MLLSQASTRQRSAVIGVNKPAGSQRNASQMVRQPKSVTPADTCLVNDRRSIDDGVTAISNDNSPARPVRKLVSFRVNSIVSAKSCVGTACRAFSGRQLVSVSPSDSYRRSRANQYIFAAGERWAHRFRSIDARLGQCCSTVESAVGGIPWRLSASLDGRRSL